MRPRLVSRPNQAELWRLAVPMMLSNVSIALLGLVDTAVVGHLENESYLAGVAIAAVIFDFLYWGVTFLRMATTGLAAQSHGADDNAAIRAVLRDGVAMALVFAAVMLLLHPTILNAALLLFDTSAAARGHARTYFEIKIWGAPGALCTMVFIGWLIGMHNAKAAMWLAAGPCLLQVVLDIVLVVVLDFGVPGVAYAATITAWTSAGFGFWLVRRELRRRPRASGVAWEWSRAKQLFQLNGNIFVRTLCLIATFAFFTNRGADQGDVVLAANAILLNLQMLTALGLDGFANALEALVGRAIGARDRAQFSASIKLGTVWSVLLALLLTVAYGLFGEILIGLLSDIPVVREVAADHLVWAAILPIVSVWCFILDGVFIGATRGREMRNSMLISTLGVFLPAWYVLQDLGNDGLWLAFILFFAARGVTMVAYFVVLERRRRFVPV